MPAMQTKPNTKKTDVVADRIRRAAEERREALELADELMQKLALDGHLTPAEAMILSGVGLTPDQVEEEKHRAAGVVRWRPLAGTAKEFAEAKQRLKRAEATSARRRPELEEEIGAMKKTLDELDGETESARRELEKMESARNALRGLYPPWVQDELNMLRREFDRGVGREIVDAAQRIKVIDGVTALDFSRSSAQVVAHADSLPQDHMAHPRLADGRGPLFVDAAGWREYLAELASEREQVVAKLAKLRKAAEPQLTRMHELQEYYVKRL